MAEVPATIKATPLAKIRLIKWLALGGTDTGAWYEASAWQDRSVHVGGVFGGATVVIEGSNADDKSDPISLRDPAGNNLTFSAAGLKQILELPRWIRPKVTAGVGSAINVIVNARGDFR